MEEWRPILQFEELYEVSNIGNVRRVARGKKFTASQIEAAKQMFANGAELKAVAEFLKTSITTAFSIKHGKTWAGDATHRSVKPMLGTDGYHRIMACKNGKYTRLPIHRAVWQAFNGPIEGRLEVNHKNLDRADNRLENLELVTHAKNIKHAIDLYKSKGLFRAVKGKKGFIAGKHSKYT